MNNKNKSKQNDYEGFLKPYSDEHPAPQDAEEASLDPQLNTIAHKIAEVVGSKDKGTVLDIGCGKGVILKKNLRNHKIH